MEEQNYIKMDYSLKTPEERIEKVKEIISNTPPSKLKPAYLEKLGDYIIFADKSQKDQLITDNHMITVNKREISFEGLVGKLENGEDGIYNMITNDKNILFQPKNKITDAEIAENPEMATLYAQILAIDEQFKRASGKRAFALKQQWKEMWKDMYEIRSAYKKPVRAMNLIRSAAKLDLSEKITIDPETSAITSSALINLYNPAHISALLCNYSRIKEDTWDKLDSDMRWLMVDLENLVDAALREQHPMYYDLVVYKIDGRQNAEIQTLLEQKYGIKHSLEYLSSLWRNKIPKLIAEKASKDYLNWYYTKVESGKWKTCSRCGQTKLASTYFFSKNKTSKDGFYSICKECRNKKG